MYKNIIKRLVDIAVSFVVLLFMLPTLAFIAVAIRLESRGNPFFLQTRTGKNGRLFRIVKFRSMVSGADKIGPHATQANDARITRFGAFLRKTSLDELPQLWNVLKGDMSLIGPRPNLPIQEKEYGAETWRKRHALRPGITGLAQVSGRSNLTLQEQIRYDLEYVEKVSLAMDVKIIFKTLKIIMSKAGVN